MVFVGQLFVSELLCTSKKKTLDKLVNFSTRYYKSASKRFFINSHAALVRSTLEGLFCRSTSSRSSTYAPTHESFATVPLMQQPLHHTELMKSAH